MAEQKGIWQDVPPVVKGIIYLVVAGGAVWGTAEIIHVVKNRKANKGNRAEEKDIKKELDDLNASSSTKQKLSNSSATAIANNLFSAMDGYGTDSVAVTKNLLKLQNQADWLAVRKAFGTREISSGKLNPTPNFTGTLEGALTDELGVIDSSVAPTLNKYFKAKGIELVL